MFQILPLVLQVSPEQQPTLFNIPRQYYGEVPLVHPNHSWFAGLGLKWYSTPAVCSKLRLFLSCCCTVLCCAVLCCAVLCCVYTLQRCAVLCCAVPSWYMCTSPSCNSAVWQAAVSPSHQFLSFQPLHSVSLALLAFFSACAAGIRISAQPISKTSLNSVMTAAAVSSSQLQKAAAVHWY